jgi:phosphoglycerate dehydrogenase-like enzyme
MTDSSDRTATKRPGGQGGPAVPALLLSHRLDGETRTILENRFPELRIATLPESGQVPNALRDATVLYRAGMPHDALRTALSQLPDLRWIHTASAGFNWVLIPEVLERPIHLTRNANVLDVPIAEYVLGTTLALLKRLPAFLALQRERRWERLLDARGLDGATVGIIGAGAIGRATAARFKPFEARTLGLKRDPSPVEEFDEVLAPHALERLLTESDVVVVACPLTDETRHLLGRREFGLMRPHAVLINVARGEVIVESELIQALSENRIAGAALDVFTEEPLPSDSPLWELDNVILTPHVSYVDPDNLRRGVEEFTENLERFIAGEPLRNEIKSRELGY